MWPGKLSAWPLKTVSLLRLQITVPAWLFKMVSFHAVSIVIRSSGTPSRFPSYTNKLPKQTAQTAYNTNCCKSAKKQ